MRVNLNNKNGISTLRIEGELDAMTVAEFRPIISGISEERPPHVLVDLSPLRLIDSTGVGAIVSLFKAVRAYGGSLDVENVHDQPLAVFRLVHLDRVLMHDAAQ